MRNDIFISLTESARIFNWLGKEIRAEKLKTDQKVFAFETQIPEPLIRHQLAFVRVAVVNDEVGISVHNYPDDIVAEVRLRQELAELFKKCGGGCGQNYELFIAGFSASVDSRYAKSPPEIRNAAIKIAAKEYGYLTEEEIEKMGEGLCAHFFDPDCCPLGCGSI